MQPSSSRAFTRRTFGRILLLPAGLATVIGLFYAEEDWRGKHAWQQYRAAAEARGVNLDWSKFIPPAVPDAQNFAMTPFLAPLFDFNPQPLQPEQSRWRDDAGAKHAQDFGNTINNLLFSAPGPRPLAGHSMDLIAAVRFIHKKDQPPAEDPPTRAAAAGSVIDTLTQFKPILDELHEASRRPYSRFNISYNDEDPAAILVPHLGVLKGAATAFFWRASAELELKHNDAAFEDLRMIIYLANAIQTEPIQVSQLIRMACLEQAEQIIWEGLTQHQWTDAQLREIQTRLGGLNFIDQQRHSMDAERAAFGVRSFDMIRTHPGYLEAVTDFKEANQAALDYGPAGWTYWEQINFHHFVDDRILPGFDASAIQIHPRIIDENLLLNPYGAGAQIHPGLAGERERNPSINPDGLTAALLHHTALLNLFFNAAHNWFRRPAQSQTTSDQTVIACALERYHMVNGKLPDTLDALVPQFLNHVPHDVCNGKPMKYHRVSDEAFALYSVGWNEKDDDGTVVKQASAPGGVDITQGDWVWPPYTPK